MVNSLEQSNYGGTVIHGFSCREIAGVQKYCLSSKLKQVNDPYIILASQTEMQLSDRHVNPNK
jgi:hypothetical protein